MNRVFKILSFVVVLLTITSTFGQGTSNRGKDFWIGFMDHIDGQGARMVLYITSDSSTTGTVTIPGQNWTKTFTVTANTMTLVDVPPDKAMVECTDCVVNKGINVTAQKNIVVYSHIYHSARSDATLVLPTTASGKEFYCMGYKQNVNNQYNQFMVIANQKGTKVRITPSDDVKRNSGVRAKGKAYEIVLNAGQVYQGQMVNNNSGFNADVTGTHIEVIDTGKNASCKTVSVFSGSTFTSIGCTGSADNLYQQMFPVSALGKNFVIVPFKSRNGDFMRILGTENSTVFRINNVQYTVGKGQYREFSVPSTGTIYLTSNKPIAVAQFQKTQRCGGGIGDPSMTMLTPIEQTLDDIVLYNSSRQNITSSFINVVIPTTGRTSFRLDGSPVLWNSVSGNTSYSYAQLTVSNGNHRLKANVGFSAIAYGFGVVESYGYVAGANIKKRDVSIKVPNSISSTGFGVCYGDSAKFKSETDTNIVKSYLWDFGDGNTSTLKNPSHLYAKTGTYKVKVKAFKGKNNGCSSYDSSLLDINIFGVPKASFTVSGNCLGDKYELLDKSTIDSGYKIKTHTWSLGDGSYGFSPSLFHYYKDTGDYLVTKTVTSENGCESIAKKIVGVNAIPSIHFTTDLLCYKSKTNFTNHSSVSRGKIDKFEWVFNYKNVDYSKDPSITFKTTGYQRIDLTAISDSGCIAHKDTNIRVYDSIQLAFNAFDECLGNAVNFANLSYAKNSKLSYNWTLGDGTLSSQTSPVHLYNKEGKYQIKLVATQDGLCMDSITGEVELFPASVPSFIYKDTCFGETTNFVSSHYVSQGQSVNRNWYVNGVPKGQDSIIDISFKNTGKQNITLRLVTSNGCISEYKRVLDIKALPTPKIYASKGVDICTFNPFALHDSTAKSDSIVGHYWKYNGTLDYSQNYNATTNKTGYYEVSLAVTSKYGCMDSTTQKVYAHPLPILDFSADKPCSGQPFRPLNKSSIKQGSIVSWQWSVNGTNQSIKQNPSLTSGNIGAVPVKLIAESNRYCVDSIEILINVLETPVSGFTFDTVCANNPTPFQSKATFAGSLVDSLAWHVNGEVKTNTKFAEFTYPRDGDFDATLVAVGMNNCADTITQSIHVAAIPRALFFTDEQEGCNPSTFPFNDHSALSNGTITKWNWDFGNGLKDTIENPSSIYNSPGLYSVKLQVESNLGCLDSLTRIDYLTVHALPIVDFTITPDIPTYLAPNVTFKDSSPNNDLVYWIWEVNSTRVADWREVDYSFPDTGWYSIRLEGEDINGCKGEASKRLFIEPIITFFIPNAFTPNGNLRNDRFKPSGLFLGMKDYSIQIFNRWGEVLYESNDPYEGWDGIANGGPVPQGTYFYRIRYTDYRNTKWYSEVGDVHILY